MNPIMKIAAATAVAALVSSPAAFAAGQGPWNGAYVGGQLQLNTVSADYVSTENGLGAAIFGGYQMQFSQHFVLGGDVFYQYNQAKDHTYPGGKANLGTKGYGVDVLAGFPVGDTGAWMPYVKVGYGWLSGHGSSSGSSTDSSIRYGAGVAWKFHQNLSLQVQYMYQKLGSSNGNLKNNNLSVGVAWHFSAQ
ncbi:MAG: porin family protein [Gammaproteobacteria bacterium]